MGTNVAAFLPKEDPELPDSYSISYWPHGLKDPVILEVAGHTTVDKVWVPDMDPTGKLLYKFGGVHPNPYLEVRTKDDRFMIIPLSSFYRLEFDGRYSKIESLREKKNAASKQSSVG